MGVVWVLVSGWIGLLAAILTVLLADPGLAGLLAVWLVTGAMTYGFLVALRFLLHRRRQTRESAEPRTA